ncbi:hypothetical protein Syun_030316 [Stephania yunnanensis]|uniref:Uncharacterized protein n=1 Tax=Stephania yunnanensis TaxID=152371 RepID=A0AAP0EAK8_9MAGN
MVECSVCRSRLGEPKHNAKNLSKAYVLQRIKTPSQNFALNALLVGGDCIFVGLQPILVYMSKIDGAFKFSPVSVNFLTEVAKVVFAIIMILLQAGRQKVGEKPLLSFSTFTQVKYQVYTNFTF